MKHTKRFFAFSLSFSIIACLAATSASAQVKSPAPQRSEIVVIPSKSPGMGTPRDTITPKPVYTAGKEPVVQKQRPGHVDPIKPIGGENPGVKVTPLKGPLATTGPITPEQIREKELKAKQPPGHIDPIKPVGRKEQPVKVMPVPIEQPTTSPVTPERTIQPVPINPDTPTTSPVTPERGFEAMPIDRDTPTTSPVGPNRRVSVSTDRPSRAPGSALDRMR